MRIKDRPSQKQAGFITMIVVLVVMLAAVLILVYMRVKSAQ